MEKPINQNNQGEIVFIRSAAESRLTLEYAPGIKAGFPSPAESYEMESLDFNRDMIHHPDTTFYGRVRGDSMIQAGISDGDLLVIDRSLEPRNGDVVVAFYDHKYTVKFFDNTHYNEGYIELRPANPEYPVFRVTAADDDFMVWGVVQYTIKNWHK
ncbi:translesion error-prone DNA polymerase V autoproteolytic subunit [Prevotella cerevisiae]|uniref:Translesion error-prone DNA polymerase V autoproteolytic subunit n=1 Tax=Segatella cerevisiae TaxID=2053716 RepID=A0ABT1C0D9_9BACT|nr:translesion error-prone DNA polymerase V autoproteolytic subunit [Segatella cerevisiae]MCO6026435.1 translesion error-prone DNA polymerase V autoproteolytic subunit [Segatella cerevisiae]